MRETTIIKADGAERNYWTDIWQFRGLFFTLAWRDLAVRYKQTLIGVSWSVVRPLLTMLIFTFVFGKVAELPSGDAPYAILVFAALLPWQFFANALMDSSNSLIANANLVSKIYFPRLIVPSSSVFVVIADFLISLFILGGLMIWFGYTPSVRIMLLPIIFAPAVALAIGAGLWFSALNVKYRDFRYVIPFVAQLGLYISPVGYSSSVVQEKFGDTAYLLFSINPMVSVIDGFRWAILRDAPSLYWPGCAVSLAIATVVLVGGLSYFRRVERDFAEVI